MKLSKGQRLVGQGKTLDEAFKDLQHQLSEALQWNINQIFYSHSRDNKHFIYSYVGGIKYGYQFYTTRTRKTKIWLLTIKNSNHILTEQAMNKIKIE